MAAVLFHEPVFSTKVEPGDKLYFYETYTTEPLTVYLNPGPGEAAPHPLIADAAGRFPAIYLSTTESAPKVVLTDADDVQKWTIEEYPLQDSDQFIDKVYELEYRVEDLDGELIFLRDDIDRLEQNDAEHTDRLDGVEERLDSLEGVSLPTGPVAAGYFTGGSSPTYKQKYGVTGSVNRTGTGTYVITFATPRSSANYIVVATAGPASSSFPLECLVKTKRTSSFTIETWYLTGGATRAKADREVNFIVYDFA
ncbi:hypothetical protein [Microbulbifer sp. 2205BS26-8]|uniref:hypothetical protein n=1 Tax=Microbulbifer sp. 2205BS26-8 TaxID=3064386 RepID=UPI00273E5C66|nr:hypothetical protein [Microbulbifer sp. 2205BS26-8]MDP5211245.1 hypothetical protein [Microbulbifer sp. 2205BS26-8]